MKNQSLRLMVGMVLSVGAFAGRLPRDFSTSATIQNKSSVVERIARVESGLLPAVILKDQSATMTLAERMRYYKVPGVSVAVINEGKIEWAKGYGVTEVDGSTPVTADTMFQAASISKPVAAMGMLALVEKGLDRELAYSHVQRLCHSMGAGDHLKDLVLKDQELKRILKPKEVQEIFKGTKFKKTTAPVMKRVLA